MVAGAPVEVVVGDRVVVVVSPEAFMLQRKKFYYYAYSSIFSPLTKLNGSCVHYVSVVLWLLLLPPRLHAG